MSGMLGCGVVFGQAQTSVVSAEVTLRASDNGNAATSGAERSDTLLVLRPAWRLERRGAGLQVSAAAAADLIASANGTTSESFLPSLQLDTLATVIDRVLFLDAGASLRQEEVNVFGPRVQPGSTVNARTAGTMRLAPRLEVRLGEEATLRAQHTWVERRVRDDVEGDERSRRASVRIERRPQPIGAALEWSRDSDDALAPDGNDLEVDRVVASLLWAPDIDWIVAVRAGRERSDLDGDVQSSSVAGASLLWSPGPRVDVAMAVDRRFFGTGWKLTARRRTPATLVRILWLREPVEAASSAGSSIGQEAFLDAILTTRTPDAAQRAELVRDLVFSRGISSGPSGPLAAAAGYLQLRSAGLLEWAYSTKRTTFSVLAYAERRERLSRADALAGPGPADTRQQGITLAYNRRLAPTMSVNLGVSRSRVVSLDAAGGRTSETDLSAALVCNLSPRSTLSLRAERRGVDSSFTGVAPFDENSVALVLGHRF